MVQVTDGPGRIPRSDRYRAMLNGRPSPEWTRRFQELTAAEHPALDAMIDFSTVTFRAPDARPALQVLHQQMEPLIARVNEGLFGPPGTEK